MSFISNLISFLFAIGVIFFCQRYDFLYDKKIEKHKKFINKKKNYILGGIIILFFLLFRSLTNNDYLDALFYLCIFAIGFSSDLKILNNPIDHNKIDILFNIELEIEMNLELK